MERVAQPFSEAEVKRIMLQLLSAVKFMHARWILHRDLKMSNVLYTEKGEIKLAGSEVTEMAALMMLMMLMMYSLGYFFCDRIRCSAQTLDWRGPSATRLQS